jgi:hypothetical protein
MFPAGEELPSLDANEGIDTRLFTGTDPNSWGPRDRRKGSLNTGRVIDSRNKSNFDRILQHLYERTMPAIGDEVQFRQTGAGSSGDVGIRTDVRGGGDSTVNLDEIFPQWRGRFGVLNDAGEIHYPNNLPSAEFVTGLMEGALGAEDPEFFARMLPMIRRSIESAPDHPDPNTRPFSGRGKTAHEYSTHAFLPSEEFVETMRGGVGSADMPYSIYDDLRTVERPAVSAPVRHPHLVTETPTGTAVDEFDQRMNGTYQAPEGDELDPDAQMREFERLMGKPGLGDTSSMNRIHSPLRALMA